MSGHSKWSTIKRAKAANDAKRAALFTKMSNLITIAAREKGGDPDTNFTLRLAIDKAKGVNMPKANIEKAIKKGTGELEGEQIEQIYYEGIIPSNYQFIVKCLTDNRNRSAANIRHLFNKYGGALTSVNWNFEEKGVIRIAKEEAEEKNLNNEDFELELIDAGAEDITVEEEGMIIYTRVSDLQAVSKFLQDKSVSVESADIEYLPKEPQDAEEGDKEKLEKFVESLEDSDDVTDYYTNAQI